ncbi:MAG: hypothetical protein JWM88_1138 [Verrucomicrobia bacterium]|nr:hypothetical protein [Verrucomicrobiota bacterium]
MNRPGPTSSDDSLLRRLVAHNDESATVAQFVELCRQSPELRHWLWEDFGRDAKVRAAVAEMIADASGTPAETFAELTNDAGTWREVRRQLKAQMPAQLYGGLTWAEVVHLVRRYQAGTVDLGVFLLAHDWRKVGKPSPLLTWAGVEFLQWTLPKGRRRPLKHLNKALALLGRYESKTKRRASLGYSDRWKLHALFYMLRHPRESYRTRELRAHLATLKLNVGTKDIRRFCTRHSIRRDVRAGRPRTRSLPQAAG